MNNKKSKQNVNFGQKLKRARESLGLTQEKVSEYLGLGPRYISDIERNKTKGSIDTLIKLCNIYNLTPNDLLSEYIYFDIETNNIELSAFYSLSKENQQIILDLIKFYNQKQKQFLLVLKYIQLLYIGKRASESFYKLSNTLFQYYRVFQY